MASCLCKHPYWPDVRAPTDTMHLCPRQSCWRWYHRWCLLRPDLGLTDNALNVDIAKKENKHPRVFEEIVYRRAGLLLSSHPKSEGPAELPPGYVSTMLSGEGSERALKRLRRAAENENEDNPFRAGGPETDAYSLPRELVLLAVQPIVRGGPHGVSGNVRAVLKARELIYEALGIFDKRSTKARTRWQDVVFQPKVWEEDEEGWVARMCVGDLEEGVEGLYGDVPALKCPQCRGTI